MTIFLGAILGVLFVGTLILGVFLYSKRRKKSAGIISCVLSIVFLIGLVFVPFGFVQVEAGELAVVKEWGQVKSYKTPGLHFRNIISEQYVTYDAKVQQLDIDKWCYVKDGTGTTQAIQVIASVQFNINEVDLIHIANEYGSLDALKLRVNTVILGLLENHATAYTIDELLTGSGKIEYQNKVRKSLTDDNNGEGVSVEDQYYIVFRQIVIEEFVLEEALEAAMLRVRLAEAERKEREEHLKKEIAEVDAVAKQDEIKANKLREIAKANAENEILVKELLAQAKEAEALGDANATIERARGEAEKLRVNSIEHARSIGINIIVDPISGEQSIDTSDPNIALLNTYLQYIAYLETWDGKLPEMVGGDDWSVLIPKP